MVNASDVQKLNAKIEKINTARTKAETQKEMLSDRLEKELASFKKQYGVDLKGKTFEETKKKIVSEVEKVSKQVGEEYELKSKIVDAIESGDYDTAYNLLGVKREEVVEETEEVGAVQTDDTEELDELLNELDSDESLDKLIDETVDEVLDEMFENPKKPAKTSKSTPVKKTESKKAESSEQGSSSGSVVMPGDFDFSSINLDIGDDDDLPDLGEEDFGFGDALSGSQFLED